MDKKLEPYYLSAETALSIVSKKFNIKIDIKEDDINLRFKKYDRNNTDDSIQMKNFFLSLGLSLQDILFNNGEDLLNEPMPIFTINTRNEVDGVCEWRAKNKVGKRAR